MHIRNDLNRFTVFENMRYLKYDLLNVLMLSVVIQDVHALTVLTQEVIALSVEIVVQDVIALTVLTQEVYALSVVIWEVCAPKWFDLWLRLCERRPGNALCDCCVLWARVAILPRLSTFRDEVASPFDSLSKKDV